jgi:hypothetical protein
VKQKQPVHRLLEEMMRQLAQELKVEKEKA